MLTRLRAGAGMAALALLTALPTFALPTHNVATGLATARDEGRVTPTKQMNLTVILKLHNRAEFDREVAAIYDPESSTYGKFFTDADFARFAPTEREIATVKNELARHGLTILDTDPQRFSLRVRGTASQVESAFQTELHTFTREGRTFQAHVRDAQLTGAAGDLVDSVAGIERHVTTPRLSFVHNPLTGKPAVRTSLATKAKQASFVSSLTDAPLTVSASETYTGGTITEKFKGLQYSANGKIAAFTPQNLEAHYGLTSLIKSGYDGSGQTIALVEGYGYPTAQADANLAASVFGLPTFTSSNFKIIYPEGKPTNPNAGILTGWDAEIALDIQSAHATAPGANILVVASSGQDDEDQIASLNYVISHKLAHVISNSWENDSEIITGKLQEEAFKAVLEKGAAAGISIQFSSGDGGDLGLGTPVGAVSVPSNSPYAVGVGGTSVLNNPYAGGQVVTGWGTNVVYLYSLGTFDPLEGYFNGGAGGGKSQFYAKPSWQSSVPGGYRQVPDVAALADPFTGFPIVLTIGGTQYGEVYGGTSLASPIFTAVWAIADQYKGSPLGFAAPIVSRLKSGQILDVTAPTSLAKYDVTGSLNDSGEVANLNAAQIFTEAEDLDNAGSNLNLYTQKTFLSAVYPGAFGYPASELDVAVSFGTDSSLTVGTGWDNVTGWGEPNGLPFIKGVTGRTTGAPLKK